MHLGLALERDHGTHDSTAAGGGGTASKIKWPRRTTGVAWSGMFENAFREIEVLQVKSDEE
jgi:hypothetical protein